MRKIAFDQLTDERKLVLGVAIAIVFLVLFFTLVIVPQRNRITGLHSQYTAEDQRVQALETFALSYPDTPKYVSSLDQRLAQINNLLPDDTDTMGFIMQAEQAAFSSGVRLGQVKPGSSVNKDRYREMPVEITVRGNFFQVVRFLKQLEDGQRFSIISNLSIQSKDDMLETKIKAIIFSFGLAPVNAPAPPVNNNASTKK